MTNIKEIAQSAGVSVSTVSRVLNDHPYVSPEKERAFYKPLTVWIIQETSTPSIFLKAKQILSASSSPSPITHITGQSLTEFLNRRMQSAVI